MPAPSPQPSRAGTSDAPKALSPADLYKLMGDTGSPDDAVPVSDSIVANVIREHQAWNAPIHPFIHPAIYPYTYIFSFAQKRVGGSPKHPFTLRSCSPSSLRPRCQRHRRQRHRVLQSECPSLRQSGNENRQRSESWMAGWTSRSWMMG